VVCKMGGEGKKGIITGGNKEASQASREKMELIRQSWLIP
jgi:hypothetical protein